MRKFSDIKGEESLDVLAEILVPITTIANDEEVRKGFETNVAMCASIALKNHKEEVLEILTVIDGRTREEMVEDLDLLTLPAILIEILNEPVIQNLFQ